MWLSLDYKEQAPASLEVMENDGEAKNTVTYVREDVVEVALRYAAVDLAMVNCRDNWCTSCNPARRAWWEACNALGRAKRIELQGLLREAGIPLPKGPFEDEI